MKVINNNPNITKYFKKNNLVKEIVYESKNKFIPVYINEKLYEEIFKEKYDQKYAFEKICNLFSITLNPKNSNNKIVGYGYADKQEDPMGISLSGNKGSGRAFFYGQCFNIKGEKTTLATSPKEIYSNGKFSLDASIKETILANILSKELSIPTFETLAILDTTESFEYLSDYLASDDTIKTTKYILPRAIEIRVNKDKRLYRVSNSFINKDKLSLDELKNFASKLANLEAEKFMKRFLHGSWSVGNISIDANLIDFDTATFVKGRHPQYSNTNKYKSNYFGYEMLGNKMILKSMCENLSKSEIDYQGLENFMDNKYKEYLKVEFCKLIGLDYNIHYKKYNYLIDRILEKFIELSRKFIPNYYDLNVMEINCNNTFVFDFSNFFQNYLINKNDNDLLLGVRLLLNETIAVNYKKIGFIKDKVNEFFSEHILLQNDDSYVLSEAINFVNLYNELFNKIKEEYDLKEIKFKQYILNMNKKYIYGDNAVYAVLSNLYSNKKIDNITLNKIINHIIYTNIINYDKNIDKHLCNLNLYEEYLSYMVITRNEYYFVLVPYTNTKIRFAKLIVNDEEYMVHHSEDENMLYSEKIPYKDISEIIDINVNILINGKQKSKQLIR